VTGSEGQIPSFQRRKNFHFNLRRPMLYNMKFSARQPRCTRLVSIHFLSHRNDSIWSTLNSVSDSSLPIACIIDFHTRYYLFFVVY
jgi:hypothetical protein